MARKRFTVLLIVAATVAFEPGASASNHLIKRSATVTTTTAIDHLNDSPASAEEKRGKLEKYGETRAGQDEKTAN